MGGEREWKGRDRVLRENQQRTPKEEIRRLQASWAGQLEKGHNTINSIRFPHISFSSFYFLKSSTSDVPG
ncbi:hypothetical protein BJX61DRAFT_467234 [Aspergillus egyptiacus]|nr:hypothetical protein BJX61DRAFT_467234 [Aspergillus egyptiacus]